MNVARVWSRLLLVSRRGLRAGTARCAPAATRLGIVFLTAGCLLWAGAESKAGSSGPQLTELRIEPPVAFIRGVGSGHTLLFTAVYEDGSTRDVTAAASIELDEPDTIRQVSPGLFEALAEGIVKIKASYEDDTAEGVVIVQPKRNQVVDFATEVAPIFSRHGCNNTNCHGSLNGQNGFKLSLFGYDPDADYEAVVRASLGRRVNLEQPEKSPLLEKPSFAVAHGGGQLIEKDSLDYGTLLSWIRAGVPQSAGQTARLERLEVFPSGFQVLEGIGSRQQIVVVGHYSDGSRQDLTRRVGYSTADDPIVEVNPSGEITAKSEGEATILIRTLGHVAGLRVGVALPRAVREREIVAANFIDELVFAKLARLDVELSDLATDGEFIRRAYLDTLGILPTVEETKSFLNDASSDKRTRLVNELLQRPEYADFWALKWGDLFASSVLTSSDGTAYLQDWLRAAFRENKPYDQFVDEVLTATGSSWEVGAVNFFSRSTEDVVTLTAQAFLGLSLECARCHDHPSAHWKREDFLATAAFFSQVARKGRRPPPTESISYVVYDQEFRHPETKQVVKPRFLNGREALIRPLQDRRQVLADWITAPNNPWFARATVNRFWNQFMGRALVDPVDDFRTSNPPTNAELLDRLAEDFIEHDYDLHHLIRRMMTSKSYQLSSVPKPSNANDEINYSRYYLRRLTAEQLMDSIVQAIGVQQDYLGYYPGVRAVNLADPGVPQPFLDMFDRPKRDAAKCERTQSLSLRQAMHMLVGDTVNEKIKLSAKNGDLRRLMEDGASDADIVDHFYLAALSRYPEAEERDHCFTVIGRAKSRVQGLQNVLWALLNTNEFLFNH